MTFSEALKKLRKSSGIPQSLIAKEINISTTQYQNYEYGKKEPTLKNLVSLADYFDVSIDYLVGRTDNPEINK